MECYALGACPAESLSNVLDVLERLSGEAPRSVHHLEMVIEGPSYAKNVKGPQLRLMHDLQHLDPESLPGSCPQLQTGGAGKAAEEWTVVHEGMPVRSKQASQLPLTVRAVSQSSCRGPDIPAFWEALSFKRQYAMVKAGRAFSCYLEGHTLEIRVLQIFKESPAGFQRGAAVSEGLWLIDIRVPVEEGRYMEAAGAVTRLSGYLEPLVMLQKP